jgi:purine-binding chemotaxis protein CheW
VSGRGGGASSSAQPALTPNQRLAALAGAPLREPAPPRPGREAAALVFLRAGRRWFAARVDAVSEVATKGAVTRVPSAPRAILGLALVRGRLVPVVSLAVLMDFSPVGEPAATLPRLLVLRAGDAEVAVVADEIRGVIEEVAAPPAASGEAERPAAAPAPFLGPEVVWQDRVAPLIDAAALIDHLQGGAS